jgi:hypothetical protein
MSDQEDFDFYMQKKTGRALTYAFLGVAAAQFPAVALWIGLIVAGVFDADDQLYIFMVGQLLYFLTTLGIGVFLVRRYLARAREEFPGTGD